jgi:pimeloyl-ACP methyl ester carboxylesterase
LAIKDVVYNNINLPIVYDVINPTIHNTILFLHGWGSNKDVMKSAFKDRFTQYRHIYIDMPGFGKSENSIILNSVDYSNIIRLFFEDMDMPSIIFGHSFGGKIATLLNPNILVLLSSAGIVVPKSFYLKTKIFIFKLFKNLAFKGLYRYFASSDVKNMDSIMYETFKKVVDEDFSIIFTNFNNRALIFWGVDDRATPLSSGVKISKLIKNSKFVEMSGDHYFFLKHSEEIERIILEEHNVK